MTYYVRSDGTVSCAGRANATSPNSASTSMSIAQANACTSFVDGDHIQYSDQGGNYTTGISIPVGGTNSNIFYENVPTETPIVANTAGDSIAISAKSKVKVAGFKVSSASTTNYNKGVSIDGTCGSLTIDAISIDMSGSSATNNYVLTSSETLSNSTISNITSSGAKTSGIYIYGASASNITLTNISNIGSNISISNITGLNMTNVVQYSAVIGNNSSLYLSNISGILTADGLGVVGGTGAGLYIKNCTFTPGSTLSNSTVTNSLSSGSFILENVSNLALSNCSSTNALGTGFSLLAAAHDVSFTNCTSTGSGNYGFWGQNGVYNITYNHCIATHGRNDGFGVFDASGVSHDITYNYCESSYNGNKTSTSDGDGFTSHLNNYNIFVNYCISHNNTSSGYAMWGTSSGHIYNSIAYNNAGNWSLEGGGKLDQVRGGFAFSLSGTNPTTGTGWSVKNCISSGNYPREIMQSSGDHTNHWSTFDYNLYYPSGPSRFASIDNGATNNDINYSTWVGYGTDDQHSPVNSNPLFTNTTTPDFHLRSTSPAINAGTNVSLTSDFAGTSVPQGSAPDIGAYEFIYPVPGGAQPSYPTYSGSAPFPVTITEMNNVISLVNLGVFKYDAYLSVNVTPRIGSFRIPGTYYWQAGSIYEVWWKSWFNDAKILPSEVVKPFTLIFKYDISALEKSLSEKRLRLAYSIDAKTWKIIPSTLDTKKKQLVIITKQGGYYMLVSGYPQTTQSVQGVETEEQLTSPEPTPTPTTQTTVPNQSSKPKHCFLFICW